MMHGTVLRLAGGAWLRKGGTSTGRNVALIGVGVMGSAIGTRLCKIRHNLTVFDLDAEKVAALVDIGATAADAAARSDIVITSLNSARKIELAVFGKNRVATSARPGTPIIDMYSIDPQTTGPFASKAKKARLRWVDSPLSGDAPKPLTGELTLMSGGDTRDVEDVHESLRDVATQFTHMGPSGAGQATKLIKGSNYRCVQ